MTGQEQRRDLSSWQADYLGLSHRTQWH